MVIVDELLLHLGVTGTDKVKAAKSAVSDFMSVFGQLLGMAGGAFAIGKAIQGFVSDAVELERLADITGESVENLSAWKQAIDAAGEDGSAFLGTIRGITENVNNLLVSGSGDVRAYLNQLGVDIFDTNGQLKETTDILMDVAGAWDSYSSREQAMIGKHLGIDDGTIRFLQKGGDEVGSLLAKQKELGVVTAAQAKSAKEISTAYYQLQNIWRTTANALIADLLPAIKWLIEGLNMASQWVIANKPIVYGFLIGLLALLAKVAIGWVVAFWPVALAIAALTALGTALYLLYDDYMVWKEGGISAFGEVWEAWERIALAIGDGLRALGRFFADFWNDPKKVWNDSITYLENRWKGMTLTEVGRDIIRSLSSGIESAWNNYLVPFFIAIDNKFQQWFGFSLITEGGAIIMSLVDGIKAEAAALDQAIEQSIVGPVYKWLKGMAGDAYDFAGTMLTRMIDAFGDKVAAVVDAFRGGVIDGLITAIREFSPVTLIQEAIESVIAYLTSGPLFQAGVALIGSLWDGVKSAWDGLVSWIVQKVDGLLSYLPDFVRDKLGLNFNLEALSATNDVSPVTALAGGGASYNASTSVGTMNVYTKSESPGAIRGAVGDALTDVNTQNQIAWTADGSTRR